MRSKLGTLGTLGSLGKIRRFESALGLFRTSPRLMNDDALPINYSSRSKEPNGFVVLVIHDCCLTYPQSLESHTSNHNGLDSPHTPSQDRCRRRCGRYVINLNISIMTPETKSFPQQPHEIPVSTPQTQLLKVFPYSFPRLPLCPLPLPHHQRHQYRRPMVCRRWRPEPHPGCGHPVREEGRSAGQHDEP